MFHGPTAGELPRLRFGPRADGEATKTAAADTCDIKPCMVWSHTSPAAALPEARSNSAGPSGSTPDTAARRLPRPLAVVLILAAAAAWARRPGAKADAAAVEAIGNRWVRQADGRLTEYLVCGDPNGTAVYFAHGWAESATFVGPYACRVAEDVGLRLISISMPGFGLSDAFPVGHVRTLDEWPVDVERVFEKERVDKFFLIGMSAGCMHVAAVALAAPERVLGMIMMTPTAPFTVEWEQGGVSSMMAIGKQILMVPYLGDFFCSVGGLLPLEIRAKFFPDIANSMWKMQQMGGEVQEALEPVVDDFRRAVWHTHRGICDTLPTISYDPPFRLADLGNFAAKGLDVVVTTTPDDRINPPFMQQWWKDQIPGSELLQIEPGWGHLHGLVPNNLRLLFQRASGACSH